MSLDNVEDSIKVIVVGDGSVGKTSMLRRFVRGEFVDQYKKTIGAEFMEKEVYVRDLKQTVTLMLWDTAGQEVFNALTASYYRGAGAAIIAFSTTDRDSFMNVEKWKQKVEAQCGNITMIMCQTKYDQRDIGAAMSDAEAEALAVKLRLPFYRTSTKDNYNVAPLFEFTARMCLSVGTAMDGGVMSMQTHATPVSAAAAADGSGAVAGSAPPSQTTGSQYQQAQQPQQQPATQTPPQHGGANPSGTQEDSAANNRPINMKDPPKKKEKKAKKPLCTML